MKKLKPGDLVEILWLDTLAGSTPWIDRDDPYPKANQARARTVGYFVRQDKEGIVLTPAEVHCNLTDCDPSISDPWRIPKGCITKIKHHKRPLQWPKSQS